MATKPPLNVHLIDRIVNLLRHWGSPSCSPKTDLIETETELSDLSALHPREYKRAREIYTELYAGRKERRNG